jgi:hypothetical protein
MGEPKLLTVLVAALLAVGLGAQAAQRWTRVTTTAGFSVDQPLGWRSVGTSPDRVALVSEGCRREGVGICDGETEITVRSEPIVATPKALRPKACWSLEEALSETEVSPGRRTQTTQLSCTIGDRRFVIVERHWKGDKRSASYGRVAMRMAKSLRYPG